MSIATEEHWTNSCRSKDPFLKKEPSYTLDRS
jgi:hypothetical protein